MPALSILRSLSPARLKNLLRYRLRELGWRVPVASRLDEFVRQIMTAAPDRHPELELPDGCIRMAHGRLHWLIQK
jgi:tRNA(Ile)-lysidine synthase